MVATVLLAQLGEHWSVQQWDEGSNHCQTNNQGH